LAWQGEKKAEYSFNAHYKKREHQDKNSQLGDIKKEETTPHCQATMPRGPGTTPLSRARFPLALSTCNCTSLHPRIQRYTISHGQPQASSLHNSHALHLQPTKASSLHSSPALRLLPAPLGKAQ